MIAVRRRGNGARWWLVLLGLVTAAVVFRAVRRPPIDLHVYLLGGSLVAGGGDDLYGPLTEQGLPFTYPPFAAVLFVPSIWAGLSVASVCITLLSVGCLLRLCFLLVARSGLCDRYGVSVPTATALAAVATVVAEPVTTNLALGQLNIILCWAVVEDALGRRRLCSGALVGLAAGVKLVPVIFVGYFLLTRRWREAVVSVATLAGTVALGAVLMPMSSRTYWSGLATLQDRVASGTVNVDGLAQVGNQSVLGAVHRLVGEQARPLWIGVSLMVLAVAAVGAWRSRGPGREVELLVVLAVAGLLVSPVSWTHHWVWITPLVIVLLVRARTSGSVARGCAITLAAGWVFTVAIRLVWLAQGVPPDPETARYYRLLAADAYVLLGVLSLGYLCWPWANQGWTATADTVPVQVGDSGQSVQ